MSRGLFFLLLICITGGGIPLQSSAFTVNSNGQKQKIDAYIQSVYSKIDFKGARKLSYATFQKAYYGYLNLLEHGQIRNRRYLTICDFSLSSNTNRLWIIDVVAKKVVVNTLVAHGSGTGEEYAAHFSNIPESHQSSLGFYVTSNTYSGSNGYSMRLNGVDGAFNSRANERDIVMHGADYVSQEYIRNNKRLGRSWGCPSVERRLAGPIIDKIKNGTCLFIYHPSKHYLNSSFWLNNPINRLPSEADRYVFKQRKNEGGEIIPDQTITEQVTDEVNDDAEIIDQNPYDTLGTYTVTLENPEVEKLLSEKNISVQEISIPKNEVTPEMKKIAVQRIKVIKKISKIEYKGKQKKTDIESEIKD